MAGAYLDKRLKGRDYLSISDFSSDEIGLLLERCPRFEKGAERPGYPIRCCKAKPWG